MQITPMMITQISNYLIIVLGCILLMTIFFRHLFVAYFKVKSSRGKKILVNIKGVMMDYWADGIIEDGFLIFKYHPKDKDKARIPLPKEDDTNESKYKDVVYTLGTIRCINVDELKNIILTPKEYKEIEGVDVKKYDHLVVRALMKPSMQEDKIKKLIILNVIILLGMVIIGFMMYQMFKNIDVITQNLVTLQKALTTV